MDLEAVVWFAEVVAFGSFTKAAEHLGESNSSVSRRIASLEQSLGYKLLLRTTRSVTLTDEGQQLLPMAQQLVRTRLAIVDWCAAQHQEPEGKLKITAPAGLARGPLTQWLALFQQQNPKVSVELLHSNQYLDFLQHRLDFAFRQGPMPSSDLVARRIFGLQYGVYAAPKWRQENGLIEQPIALQQYSVVATGIQSKPMPWRFHNDQWVPEKVSLMYEDMQQCLSAAAMTGGVTYAAQSEAEPFVARGELEEILVNFRAPPADFYLVYPDRSLPSPKQVSFLHFISLALANMTARKGLIVYGNSDA